MSDSKEALASYNADPRVALALVETVAAIIEDAHVFTDPPNLDRLVDKIVAANTTGLVIGNALKCGASESEILRAIHTGAISGNVFDDSNLSLTLAALTS